MTRLLKYSEFSKKLDEGKGSHLPDEGDGFFDTFASTINDAVNKELKEMYSKDLKDTSAKFDRAGIVIDLIKKRFILKKEIWKNAADDLKEAIEDSEYVNSYRDSLLFYKYVPMIKDVLEEEIEKADKSDTIYPDDDFINALDNVYNMYNAEHNILIDSRIHETLSATHDNGGRPFVVDDEKGRSRVYKEVLFLGDKIKGIKKGEDSSSFLIELKDKNTYVFVGTRLFKFSTDEPIIKFYSPIGNSDVAYPYAESENYYYMFLDQVAVKKEDIKGKDKYQSYYKDKENIEKIPLKNLDILEERLNERKHILNISQFINETAEYISVGKHAPKASWMYPNPEEKEFNLRTDDTVKYRLLKFIYNKGLKGVRYSDVLRYLFEEIKGEKYNWEKDRGYYSSVLSGEGGKTLGILSAFCTKNENGRYVLTNPELLEHFSDIDVKLLKDNGYEDKDIEFYKFMGTLRIMAEPYK